MTISPVNATPANFARYGQVVKTPAGAPTSQAADYKLWSDIAHFAIDGETEIGLCRVFRLPVARIRGMERHLRTPEILIPIDAAFLLPLLRDDDASAGAAVFRVAPGEAVVVGAGVWHGACLPVGAHAASYFVIFRRGTPHEDVEKKDIAPFDVEAA
jgi:ureidoglycolate hydrolase